MTERQKLLEVSVVEDCDTDIYTIGELDFGVPGDAHEWIGKRRVELTAFLRWLADRCEQKAAPFEERTW